MTSYRPAEVIASVHIADVGVATSVSLMRRVPKPFSIDGLRHANLAIAAPLGSMAAGKPPQVGRAALVAFWDDATALDSFIDAHPLAAALAGGWRARLEPLRAYGRWPGAPTDLPTARQVDHSGRSIVLTLGRLRLSQTKRFLATSRPAEQAALEAEGLVWGTAMARPPFVSTCSIWESSKALSTYAFGQGRPGHHDAIEEDRRQGFHHESAFIRFRPIEEQGQLEGRNPLRG